MSKSFMSKSFKSIKNAVKTTETANGHLWQVQSDKHKAVLTVNFDATSRANEIAALPLAHPIRNYFKTPTDNTPIAQAAAKMTHEMLSSKWHAQNHYSFVINPEIKNAEFKEAAKGVIADSLLPKIMDDAKQRGETGIFIYPSEGQEPHVEWLENMMMDAVDPKEIGVCPAWVQIAERKKVRAMEVFFFNKKSGVVAPEQAEAGLSAQEYVL